MNLLFTICARAGSKGVKSKNTRNFLEYPIAYFTLSTYQLFTEKFSKEYGKIDLAVNTDSGKLIEQIEETKISFIHIKRKENLAGDFVSKTDVISDTLSEMHSIKDYPYDIVVDLDLTSPLRKIDDIKGVIDTLIMKREADVAFSATGSRRLPFFNMVSEDIDGFYNILINTGYVSRQQAPKCYDMNASIYAYRKEFISSKATTKVLDGKAVVWEMKDTAVLDIDSEEDLELMQVLARYFYDKYEEYREVYLGIKKII